MANLENPLPRNLAPEHVIPETVVLSFGGGIAGFLFGRLVSPSTFVAAMAGLIGAFAGALAARARGMVAHPRKPPDRISEVVSYLSEHLGPEMTAFVSGAESPVVVNRWLAGNVLPDSLERGRLIAARQAVEELTEAYSDDMIQSWFLGMNDWLGDRAPALILRHGQQPGDWSAVQPAAEEFAESAY